MVKLTEADVGKVYLNGDGTQVLVIHAVDTMHISKYRFIGGVNQGTECEYRSFYNEDGEVFGFGLGEKKNLVSEYTPPRTLEEVAGDMAERLRREVESDGDELYDNDKVSLLKEYEALKGGE